MAFPLYRQVQLICTLNVSLEILWVVTLETCLTDSSEKHQLWHDNTAGNNIERCRVRRKILNENDYFFQITFKLDLNQGRVEREKGDRIDPPKTPYFRCHGSQVVVHQHHLLEPVLQVRTETTQCKALTTYTS